MRPRPYFLHRGMVRAGGDRQRRWRRAHPQKERYQIEHLARRTQLCQGDCLELMKDIPDGSVDMVLCDLPYGITRNSWDVRIPFAPLWEQYRRICKENAAICLFAQMPFAAELVMSNRKMYRYEWVYEKACASGFLNANRMPLRAHEMVQVFYRRLPTYHPQKTPGKPYARRCVRANTSTDYGKHNSRFTQNKTGERFPIDVIRFSNCSWGLDRDFHPTQKPVALCEYLIRTYTNEGDTVLDNCMGSGSTGVACVNTGRDFIGMELDFEYFLTAKERIEKSQKTKI